MTRRTTFRSALFALVATPALLLVTDRADARLSAEETAPFHDSDGDLLPDSVERMLLTSVSSIDSDGDQIEDFLDAVQHRQLTPHSGPPLAKDHELRVIVSTETSMDGQEHVVVNVLVRLMNGGRIHQLVPFVFLRNAAYPIGGMLGNGLAHFGYHRDPVEGDFLVYSGRLCSPEQFRAVLPCIVGVRAVIDDRALMRGSYLTTVSDVPVALVPYSSSAHSYVAQTLSPSDPPPGDFWSSSRACELILEVQGATSNGILCEIIRGECVDVPTLQCAPGCAGMAGRVMTIPSGLGTLRGG